MIALTFWNLVSIFVFIFLGFYILFSVLVVRQTYLLSKTLTTGLSPVVKFLGYLNLALAIVVLAIAAFAL